MIYQSTHKFNLRGNVGCIGLLVLVLTTTSNLIAADNESVISIGSSRQLFIDKKFIQTSSNVELTVNPARKAGPIDIPFESNGMVSIIEFGGRYFLYTRIVDQRGMAVATSTDGIKWDVPPPRAFGTGRKLPLPGVDSGSVFIDPNDQEFPFKGIFDIRQADPWGLDPSKVGDVERTVRGKTQASARGGLYLFQSPDGFRWELVPGLPVPLLCDTQNQVLFDPYLKRYVAYLRAFPTLGGPQHNKRCVARTEMADLNKMPWPFRLNPHNKPPGKHDFPYIHDEMPIVLGIDGDDPRQADLYNPAVHVYRWADHAYVAFPSLYRTWGYSGQNVSFGRDHRGKRSNDGLFETHLAVSRDGRHFTRYRVPYVDAGLIQDREGKAGDLDCGLIMLGIGLIRHGDEIWQYYAGTRRTHMSRDDGVKYGFHGGGIFRLVQRLDGFVSADVDYRGGELVTPPVEFQGNRMVVNAACHGLGEIRVEIQDAAGQPIPDYSLADAVWIDRNGTNQEVWWKKGPDVGKLAGNPVRIRFAMKSAKLFAFQFVARTTPLNTDPRGTKGGRG